MNNRSVQVALVASLLTLTAGSARAEGLPADLPIPATQLHYADRALNDEAQTSPIHGTIDFVHHPTIGRPALLDLRTDQLRVVLSLPVGADAAQAHVKLVDRHGGRGEVPLQVSVAAKVGAEGPAARSGERRQCWLLRLPLTGARPGLFDLAVTLEDVSETQFNAVRLFAEITGSEQVVLCGDFQHHAANGETLLRFRDKINARASEIAWVAVIGDICDNDVQNETHIVELATEAREHPVQPSYPSEYNTVGKHVLRGLKVPVVLIPGNHDGAAANQNYRTVAHSCPGVIVGPDPCNPGGVQETAYDGLHYFRRTFGPLYSAFTFGETRFLCVNSFELPRRDRLGYKSIVTNWGGSIQDEQLRWIAEEVAQAEQAGHEVVLLMHHDPRGGSMGKQLGFYHEARDYDLTSTIRIAESYIGYLFGNLFRLQQEWMRPNQAHATRLLRLVATSDSVRAVIMGHDNKNWIDAYAPGVDVYAPKVSREFNPPQVAKIEVADGERPLVAALAAGDFGRFLELTETGNKKLSDDERIELLRRLQPAVEQERARARPTADAATTADEVQRARAALATVTADHELFFIHVDDVGAYKHGDERAYEDYGYVLAKLHGGRFSQLTPFRLTIANTPRQTVDLGKLLE